MSSKPNLRQLLTSLLGAFFGVQSSKVQKRDFEHGHDWRLYAALAVLLTLLMVICLVKIVHVIIDGYGYT